MSLPARLGLLSILAALSSAAFCQNFQNCRANALDSVAVDVLKLRSELRHEAVPTNSATVPPRIAAKLKELKDALANTAETAFRCAPAADSADQLQSSLAEALHANRSAQTETVEAVRGNKDVGAFGSDLAVQVFQLFGKPRILEVDFRYGIECGDDNLLLIFEVPSDETAVAWRETLRWDTHSYNTVGDALGDFVLLTPLTGSYQHPTWRYLVAHGEPGCGETPRASHFVLELLTPTADPAQPTVDWHFSDSYSAGTSVPRLATTEDTIDFRMLPAAPPHADPEVKPTKTPAPAAPPPGGKEAIYRFHLDSAGHVVPTPLASSDSQPGPADSPR